MGPTTIHSPRIVFGPRHVSMNTSEQPVEFVSNPIENMTPTLDSNSSDISFNSASSENSPQLDVNADSSPTFLVGVDAVKGKIDYKKLITLFGCQEIDEELVKRIERLTKMPAHPFLKRGLYIQAPPAFNFLQVYSFPTETWTCS